MSLPDALRLLLDGPLPWQAATVLGGRCVWLHYTRNGRPEGRPLNPSSPDKDAAR